MKNIKNIVLPLIALALLSCESEKITISPSKKKITVTISNTENYSSEYVYHLFIRNIHTNEEKSITLYENQRTIPVNIEIEEGYYNIYHFLFARKNTTQLATVYAGAQIHTILKKSQNIELPLKEVTPECSISTDTEILCISVNQKLTGTTHKITSFTMKNKSGKFSKPDTTNMTEDQYNAYYKVSDIGKPYQIHLSYTIKDCYDKNYFKSQNITITTTRFENYSVTD